MNKQKLAGRFCRDMDMILRGEKVEPKGPAPDEYRKAVELARTLAETDFGGECGIRQELRRRLLDRFNAHEAGHVEKTKRNYAELDDEELENVAGGNTGGEEQDPKHCRLCSCKRRVMDIEGGTCPDCGHSVNYHPY
jgi:hypothetical protein